MGPWHLGSTQNLSFFLLLVKLKSEPKQNIIKSRGNPFISYLNISDNLFNLYVLDMLFKLSSMYIVLYLKIL